MLLFTIIFGGLLLMMGHHSRAESLFYYFRLEDQVPENHLLRLIDGHVNFEFIRAKLKDAYSEAGRPSTVLFLTLTGAFFAFGRRFFLKDTGRKLAHFDRELNAGRAPMPPHLHREELN
jgi:hypothetical protein